MSVDSISKRPFFGLQVAPKQRNEPVYDRAIAQNRQQNKDVPKIQTALRETELERRWTSWLPAPAGKPVVPLPRTDVQIDGKAPARLATTSGSAGSEPVEF